MINIILLCNKEFNFKEANIIEIKNQVKFFNKK